MPKIAIVHDWLVNPGGAEKVVMELHKLYPEAPIYTSAYNPEKFPEFAGAEVRTLWFDKIKLARTKQQFFSIPRALTYRSLDLSDYDIVISSASAEAKYVRTGKNTLHLCYCHTPIRYYWSDYDWYRMHPPFGRLNWLAALLLPVLIGPLRWMDFRFAQDVNRFIANSKTVQGRIKRYYKRDSDIIYPPVCTDRYISSTHPKDGYYVVLGRQVAYKRLDLVVDAFNTLGLPVKVSGSGEELGVQRPRAGKNIEFLGRVEDEELPALFAGARALIFPAEEDFGIVPVEAMAAGLPVIAYGVGGATETVIEGLSGTLFYEQTPEALAEAVRAFDGMTFDPAAIRAHAQTFDNAVFASRMKDYVDTAWEEFKSK